MTLVTAEISEREVEKMRGMDEKRKLEKKKASLLGKTVSFSSFRVSLRFCLCSREGKTEEEDEIKGFIYRRRDDLVINCFD